VRRSAALLLSGLVVFGLAACESTQEKSRRLGKDAGKLKQQRGLAIAEPSTDVKVGQTAVVYDPEYGAAAIVELRNVTKQAQFGVPVLIDVADARGRSVFKNNTPGLDPSLTGTSFLGPGQDMLWVNDQIQPVAPPKAVKVVVGAARGKPVAKAPELFVSNAKLEQDPVSGIAATGYVKNRSTIDQRNVTVYGVARKGGRIVAAGRSGIKRIRAGRRGRFKIFWIGDPRGAQLEISAPPTTFA
jgi:hypothetical protein